MFPALGPAFGVPFQRVGDTTSSGTATVLAIPFLNARLSFYPIMKLGGKEERGLFVSKSHPPGVGAGLH